ncbi:hypothetical protein BMS3Bbin01_00358 [bacterium BMS3Bbin01]|nr:hypothetical protein BMS3Bbin01_00358 [bacterium BMS3Bbin01]
MIGDVPDEMLSSEQEEALRRATVVLLDRFFADICHLEAGGDFGDTDMVEYLPARFASKYDHLFAKEFLICVATVAGKLVSPLHSMLACVGEELALHALVTEAEGILEARDAGVDLADFLELATEDADYELLFSMAWDGIEDSHTGRDMRVANLAFDDWFRPFRETDPVHPYVESDFSSFS